MTANTRKLWKKYFLLGARIILNCSLAECYSRVMFYHFFLRAFGRREQTVFFFNQDPNVQSKHFQHFSSDSVFSSKQCRTIGVNKRAEHFMLRPESPCKVICT